MITNGKLHLVLDYDDSEKVAVEVLRDALSVVEYFIEDTMTNGELSEVDMKDLQDNFKYKEAIETVIDYFGG